VLTKDFFYMQQYALPNIPISVEQVISDLQSLGGDQALFMPAITTINKAPIVVPPSPQPYPSKLIMGNSTLPPHRAPGLTITPSLALALNIAFTEACLDGPVYNHADMRIIAFPADDLIAALQYGPQPAAVWTSGEDNLRMAFHGNLSFADDALIAYTDIFVKDVFRGLGDAPAEHLNAMCQNDISGDTASVTEMGEFLDFEEWMDEYLNVSPSQDHDDNSDLEAVS